MIVLDTNVVSELTRPEPEGRVDAWLDSQRSADLYLTTISEAELRYGLVIMPRGKRRRAIAATIDQILEEYEKRILSFDRSAALAYSEIAAQRQTAGLPIKEFDCQIAAIAQSVGADIATRNVRDFDGCGVGIINPWEHQPVFSNP